MYAKQALKCYRKRNRWPKNGSAELENFRLAAMQKFGLLQGSVIYVAFICSFLNDWRFSFVRYSGETTDYLRVTNYVS